MKVMLINGSPNRKGCTNRALEEVKRALEENQVEGKIIHIGAKNIRGCRDCGYCTGNRGKCVFADEVNEVIEELKTVDGLIIGSPVYFSSPSGTLISFLDRLFHAAPYEALAHKPGASVVSARRAGTTASFDVLNKYFMIRQMPVVSSQYWNMVHGYSASEVEKDEEGLQIMRTLGRNMAWLIKAIRLAEQNGIKKPEESEQKIRTDFIRSQEERDH